MDLFFTNIAYASVDSVISKINTLIINPLIILLFALALMYFLYGVFEFLSNGDNEEKKTTGKKHMIWGIVGLTVMMGVWFILGVILDTFNITGINPQEGTVQLDEYNPSYPQVK
ncbi:MAG: hypothetical protein WC264_01335 [Candidatus Paceibacterota bacterium]|jgi:uncharacterized membrane protein YidH (DUF202 family)